MPTLCFYFGNRSASVVQVGGGGRLRKHEPFLRSLPTQFKIEDEDEKRRRRIREGTLPAPTPPVDLELVAYNDESAKLIKAITRLRADANAAREKIAQVEAQQFAKAAVDERRRLEKRLLLANQELTLASVQEAALLDEMEVLDIAYVAAAALRAVLQ